MAERRSERAAAHIGLGSQQDPLLEHRGRCLVIAQQQMSQAEEMQVLLAEAGIEPDGALKVGNGCLWLARVERKRAAGGQSKGVIRAELQRLVDDGFRRFTSSWTSKMSVRSRS